MICNSICGVKLGVDGRSRLFFVMKRMEFQTEEAVVVNIIGTVKASGQRQAVNMPFPRMIGSVT